MGLLKDMFALHRLGQEQLRNLDVKGRMSAAQSAMDQLNAEMGGMQLNGATVNRDDPLRVDAVATVTAARQTGAMINDNPLVELSLLVMLPTGVPIPVTVSALVALINLPRVQPGSRLHVSLNPAVPASTHIEWNAQ